MKRIILTVVYFGKWPQWFSAYVASCVTNQDIDWLFVTDCPIADIQAPNIRLVPMTMHEFNELASRTLGISVHKLPYTHDDLRPAYGQIFHDLYHGYDFWGHVDVDVVWGRIRRFVTDDELIDCDIFSARKEAFAGHFTLYRNVPEINMLFRKNKKWETALSDSAFHHFNEQEMGIFIKYCLPKELRGKYRFCWSEDVILDWWALFRRRHGWQWRQGSLFDGRGKEHMYIHFMTWKPYMRHCDFSIGELPEQFSINPHGIWSQPMTFWEKLALRGNIRFVLQSYLRYCAWYWLDRSRWLKWLRPKQHAKRNPAATS